LLHAGPDDQVQRLLIAAQPGTYVRPHRHSEQWEMLVLQSGLMDVLYFGEDGELLDRQTVDSKSPLVQIAPGVIHGCVMRAPDTLVLEVKPGPYRPTEFVAWAPEEGQAGARDLLNWATSASVGQIWRAV
jgi:cupin fold WbuC family metalloprotein